MLSLPPAVCCRAPFQCRAVHPELAQNPCGDEKPLLTHHLHAPASPARGGTLWPLLLRLESHPLPVAIPTRPAPSSLGPSAPSHSSEPSRTLTPTRLLAHSTSRQDEVGFRSSLALPCNLSGSVSTTAVLASVCLPAPTGALLHERGFLKLEGARKNEVGAWIVPPP